MKHEGRPLSYFEAALQEGYKIFLESMYLPLHRKTNEQFSIGDRNTVLIVLRCMRRWAPRSRTARGLARERGD